MTCEGCVTPVPDRQRLCVPCFTAQYGPAPHAGESEAAVERLLQQARSARLAEERRTGRRRHTIEDGWMQRPGAGVINFNADTQGDGFA